MLTVELDPAWDPSVAERLRLASREASASNGEKETLLSIATSHLSALRASDLPECMRPSFEHVTQIISAPNSSYETTISAMPGQLVHSLLGTISELEDAYLSAFGRQRALECPEAWFDPLLPEGEGFEKEDFERYYARVGPLLPNFPKSVLEDWLHRHAAFAFEQYGWLDYHSFRFEEETWPIERVALVRSGVEDTVNSWALDFHESDRRDPLALYMTEHGTWPVQPIVLDNTSELRDPDGLPLARLHLLEGHLRLAYLRGLALRNPESVADRHRVWLVTGASKRIAGA